MKNPKQLWQLEKQYNVLLKRLKTCPDSKYESALAAFKLVKNQIINLQNSD
jgi:hypothetical protein